MEINIYWDLRSGVCWYRGGLVAVASFSASYTDLRQKAATWSKIIRERTTERKKKHPRSCFFPRNKRAPQFITVWLEKYIQIYISSWQAQRKAAIDYILLWEDKDKKNASSSVVIILCSWNNQQWVHFRINSQQRILIFLHLLPRHNDFSTNVCLATTALPLSLAFFLSLGKYSPHIYEAEPAS